MRAPATAFVIFPDAEIDRLFNGEHVGVFICGALRVEAEECAYAKTGFEIIGAEVLHAPDAKDGEFVGEEHWLRHGVSRFCRHPTIVRDIHDALEKERNAALEAA